ncbi:MAG: hypothetical protein LC126_28660 [Bryobacterales bacterium]|nr:hypothetical protein [Bryobacterales bacterium]
MRRQVLAVHYPAAIIGGNVLPVAGWKIPIPLFTPQQNAHIALVRADQRMAFRSTCESGGGSPQCNQHQPCIRLELGPKPSGAG